MPCGVGVGLIQEGEVLNFVRDLVRSYVDISPTEVIVPNATVLFFIIAFSKGIGGSLEWICPKAVLGYGVGVCV